MLVLPMGSPRFEHARPELQQTIVFGETPQLDSQPVEVANGRLIPGPRFSAAELMLLRALSRERHGSTTPEQTGTLLLPTPKQLARIALNERMGCWELPTYDDPKPRARYGSLSIKGIQGALAHKTMYQVFYGTASIPPGHFLDHLCENKSCCYPRHVEAVPPANNTIRALLAVRHAADQLGFDFD